MTAPQPRTRQPKQLDAGILQAEISSFRLHLAAEGKSARTIGGYAGAVRWFAAAWLLPQPSRTSWDQVDAPDVQRWMVHLLSRYSSAYASIQFRALRQFFKWLAAEENLPDPMDRLRAPKVAVPGSPGVHQRRTIGPRARLPRRHVRPAPRRAGGSG